MALDIEAIREAVAAKVKSVTDAAEETANVYAYAHDAPQLNAFMVMPAPFENGQYVNYWGSFARSLCAIGLRVEIRVGGNDVDAQKQLDRYLSTQVPEIIAAFEADKTLGGLVDSVLLRDSMVPGRFAPDEAATRTWLSSSVALEVRARRS